MMASKVTQPDAAGESQKTQEPRDDHLQSLSNTKKTDSTAENRRYCGLENQGSSSCLNAVLQTLFMTKGFRQHVQRLGGRVGSSDGSLAGELKKLFSELETQQNTAVSAAGVMKSLGITDVHKQRDAAEHLQLIIEKTPGSSELFKGTMKTTRTCRSCRHKAEETPEEDFLSLQVSLQNSQEVENALKEYVDQMCGECQLFCFDCKNTTDCEKKSEMISFPEILIIQLRRFERTSCGYDKSDVKVIIRPHIKVSLHKYELYAIINYTGSYDVGYHNADIKCEDGIWRRFDDRSVSESSLNGVFRNESSTHRSSEACLLLYGER